MGVIGDLDPQWLDEFLAMGADLYRGVLPAKLVELMATAVDASWTHLYAPGARRHIQGALANGATIEEIMEVLKLSRALGVDACELGAPILAEELAAYQQRHWPGHPIAEASGQLRGGRSWLPAGPAAHIPNGIPSCGVRARPSREAGGTPT
jgi:alkylhydroperoxidase/carboxymuconolactone decarboxylase family protein YurZ